MVKNILIACGLVFGSYTANAQCVDWVNPDPEGAWSDFGMAPCNNESIEITDFEVWQSEAYDLEGVLAGGTYTFSHCNGSSGTWVPEYTIIAPSGNVEAFGAGDGDSCSVSWTATETGTYIIVINEVDECGVEGSEDNGFPMITTISGGMECPDPPIIVEGAVGFESGLPDCWMALDEDGDGFNWQFIEPTPSFEGAFAIASYSYDDINEEALNPDNYLITPQLEMGTGDSLYFVIRSLNNVFVAENYSVLVSTTGTDIEDFTDLVWTEELSSSNWEGRSIDLSAYNNQNIYIAFRHHDVSDELGLALDAVALPGTINCQPNGVEELVAVDARIYPNPAVDVINIESKINGQATIRIFDAVGKLLTQNVIVLKGGNYVQSIAHLEKGMYIMQITSKEQIATERFIKQ